MAPSSAAMCAGVISLGAAYRYAPSLGTWLSNDAALVGTVLSSYKINTVREGRGASEGGAWGCGGRVTSMTWCFECLVVF
jgi:hypothetical protein